MKRIYSILAAIAVLAGCSYDYPETIRIEGGKLHVQGIALDQKEKCMYCSFTSAFFRTDLQGNITGSITGINGHLGAMTFGSRSRKVYASLEVKDDAIGRGVSDALGAKRHEKSGSTFYVAEIDVDKVDSLDVPFEKAVRLHAIEEVRKDYLDSVEVDGQMKEHRYGCSGMDGITIGPEFGAKNRRQRFLYVAYGIYGDTTRIDNDHNILLCYRLDDFSKPVHKYFIHTGNTRYGVQNLAYDKYSGKMYLAVYKGRKSSYPNYSHFSLDIRQKPYMAPLRDVPYEKSDVEQLDVCEAWHAKWGSTGMCPLGDGRWYISENGKEDGIQVCNARLQNSPIQPFLN